MKKVCMILSLSLLIFINANVSAQEANLLKETSAKLETSSITEELIDAAIAKDTMSIKDKEAYLLAEGTEVWYNTVCSVNNNICCKSCTADGNPDSCAKTRFSKCSACGHGRSSHSARRQ